jgi:hypothetical protein
MSLDSTAELLFKINADSADAEGNIARFRTLLGKDLEGIGAEFDDWASKVLGDLSTVQGAMTAGGAVMAAGLVAAGAAAVHAADAYVDYVSEIAQGSKVTGIAVEDMSGLHFAATETGSSYEALTHGITRFEAEVVKANATEEGRVKIARLLGVTNQQVADGEKNILPLLMASADRFKSLASGTERAALARELFGRGGAELLGMLSQGADGLKRFTDEARRMGLIVGHDDVVAMKEYKASLNTIKAQQEALDVEWGKRTLPLMESLKIGWLSVVMMLSGKGVPANNFAASLAATMDVLKAQVEATGKALANIGGGEGKDGLGSAPEKVAKVRAEFTGLADILETVKERMANSVGGQAQIDEQIDHLGVEVAKATAKFNELRKAGELAPQAVKQGMSALAQLPAAIQSLTTQLTDKLHDKQNEEFDQFAADMRQRIAGQRTKSEADQQAAWDAEIAKLREQLGKKKDLTSTQQQALDALISQLAKAGAEKIGREHSEAVQAAGEDLQKRIAGQQEKSYESELQQWAIEMAGLRRQLKLKNELTADNEKALEALDKAGRDRINRNQQSEFAQELQNLKSAHNKLLEAEMTKEQKLKAEYDRDVANYSQTRLAKALLDVKDIGQQQVVVAQFAAIRKMLFAGYTADLNALYNSQGWTGVFGSKFGEMLRGDEAALKQWQTSTNQSVEMVKLSMTALDQVAKEAFDHMAQGMGGGIANAIVYSKSIGQAMQAAAASTLESIAAQCLIQAVYSTAWGFYDIAVGNFTGAAAAFEAAALFGSVGVGAAIAGRAVAAGQEQSAGAGKASMPPGTGGVSGSGSGGGYGGGMSQQRTPHLTVNVYGHVVGVAGVAQLAGMLNDAVLNQDVTLTATNTRTGAQVTR